MNTSSVSRHRAASTSSHIPTPDPSFVPRSILVHPSSHTDPDEAPETANDAVNLLAPLLKYLPKHVDSSNLLRLLNKRNVHHTAFGQFRDRETWREENPHVLHEAINPLQRTESCPHSRTHTPDPVSLTPLETATHLHPQQIHSGEYNNDSDAYISVESYTRTSTSAKSSHPRQLPHDLTTLSLPSLDHENTYTKATDNGNTSSDNDTQTNLRMNDGTLAHSEEVSPSPVCHAAALPPVISVDAANPISSTSPPRSPYTARTQSTRSLSCLPFRTHAPLQRQISISSLASTACTCSSTTSNASRTSSIRFAPLPDKIDLEQARGRTPVFSFAMGVKGRTNLLKGKMRVGDQSDDDDDEYEEEEEDSFSDTSNNSDAVERYPRDGLLDDEEVGVPCGNDGSESRKRGKRKSKTKLGDDVTISYDANGNVVEKRPLGVTLEEVRLIYKVCKKPFLMSFTQLVLPPKKTKKHRSVTASAPISPNSHDSGSPQNKIEDDDDRGRSRMAADRSAAFTSHIHHNKASSPVHDPTPSKDLPKPSPVLQSGNTIIIPEAPRSRSSSNGSIKPIHSSTPPISPNSSRPGSKHTTPHGRTLPLPMLFSPPQQQALPRPIPLSSSDASPAVHSASSSRVSSPKSSTDSPTNSVSVDITDHDEVTPMPTPRSRSPMFSFRNAFTSLRMTGVTSGIAEPAKETSEEHGSLNIDPSATSNPARGLKFFPLFRDTRPNGTEIKVLTNDNGSETEDEEGTEQDTDLAFSSSSPSASSPESRATLPDEQEDIHADRFLLDFVPSSSSASHRYVHDDSRGDSSPDNFDIDVDNEEMALGDVDFEDFEAEEYTSPRTAPHVSSFSVPKLFAKQHLLATTSPKTVRTAAGKPKVVVKRQTKKRVAVV